MMGERGVGLIEIMVAITILSIVLLALGSLMFQATRDMNRSGAVAYRSAAQQSAAAWANGVPWDSLHAPPGGPVGCVTDTAGLLTYTRCTTLFTMSNKLKRLTVVITPTGRLIVPPDTVAVDRNKPLVGSPFR
jgi:prepilin-type N-terminal cleavage/methylation domain-containing protein